MVSDWNDRSAMRAGFYLLANPERTFIRRRSVYPAKIRDPAKSVERRAPRAARVTRPQNAARGRRSTDLCDSLLRRGFFLVFGGFLGFRFGLRLRLALFRLWLRFGL